MGYYTDHSLDIYPFNPDLYNLFVEDTGYAEGYSTKWYRHQQDCKNLSARYPGHLIVLSGKGEDAGDLWKEAYLQGEIVWKWQLDCEIPDVPEGIKELAKREYAKTGEAQQRVAKLQEYTGID